MTARFYIDQVNAIARSSTLMTDEQVREVAQLRHHFSNQVLNAKALLAILPQPGLDKTGPRLAKSLLQE